VTELAARRPRARSGRWKRVLLFLAVAGPGLIAANAGNDAGGILTYASAGAQFGYRTLFVMVLVTVGLRPSLLGGTPSARKRLVERRTRRPCFCGDRSWGQVEGWSRDGVRHWRQQKRPFAGFF
jgi:hypothetical protein